MQFRKSIPRPLKMRILCIDPGTAITGYGVIDKQGRNSAHVAHGCIATHKDTSKEKRLLSLEKQLIAIFKEYKPDIVAVESLFFFKNLKTAITVAQARGVILYEIKKNRMPLSNYTPLQVKQALTGYGKAEKKQVQLMTKSILRLKSLPKPDDTADAIAIAICHLNSRKINNLR